MNAEALAPDINVKMDALAAQVKTLLTAHDSDFSRAGSVGTYLDDAVDSRTRRERLDLMCNSTSDPERYAEIAWVGEQQGGVDLIFSGEPIDVQDRFRIYVYWGVRKGTDTLSTEASNFRAAIRQRSAPLGVASSLRSTGSFEHVDGADTWEVETRIEDVQTTFRLIDKQNNEYRHEAAITCVVTGAPK